IDSERSRCPPVVFRSVRPGYLESHKPPDSHLRTAMGAIFPDAGGRRPHLYVQPRALLRRHPKPHMDQRASGILLSGRPWVQRQGGYQRIVEELRAARGYRVRSLRRGKTALRVGAGINYDFINLQSYQNEDNVAPFAGDTTVNGPIPIAKPWSTTPGGNPFPYSSTPPVGKFPVGAVYDPVPPDFKTTEVYSWNAGLQRQFTPRLFATISYIGSNTIHLPTNVELNPGVYIPGNCVAGQYGLAAAGPCSTTGNVNARRVLNLANPVAATAISNVTAYDSGATANYNGMLVSENWRATNRV